MSIKINGGGTSAEYMNFHSYPQRGGTPGRGTLVSPAPPCVARYTVNLITARYTVRSIIGATLLRFKVGAKDVQVQGVRLSLPLK